MRARRWIEAALAACAIAMVAPAEGAQKVDQEAVVRAVRDCYEGLLEGDLERIERGVHPSLQRVGFQMMPGGREVLAYLDRHALLEYARLGVGKDQEGAVEVEVLDVYENTASVKVAVGGELAFAHVARINDAWRVINLASAAPEAEDPGATGEAARAAVEQAGLDYVDGFYAGSVERLEKALHPRLQKVVVQKLPNGREVFRYTSADGLAEYARSGLSKKPEDERKVSVTIQAMGENAASIRVDSADFVDFCHVVRLNGEWKIANVLWAPLEKE